MRQGTKDLALDVNLFLLNGAAVLLRFPTILFLKLGDTTIIGKGSTILQSPPHKTDSKGFGVGGDCCQAGRASGSHLDQTAPLTFKKCDFWPPK